MPKKSAALHATPTANKRTVHRTVSIGVNCLQMFASSAGSIETVATRDNAVLVLSAVQLEGLYAPHAVV